MAIVNSVTELIGNTPLLKIDSKIHGLKNFEIYCKLEFLNPFGSLKDRVAANLLIPHVDEIKSKNKIVIASSSGNTSKALSVLTKLHDIPFMTITNRIKVNQVRKIIQVLGTKIRELPGLSQCPDPNDPHDPLTVVNKIVEDFPDKYYHADQYFDTANIKAHEKSGQEILQDLTPDYLFGYLGTCGSTVGISKAIKEKNPNLTTIGIVTKEAEYVPGGRNENELFDTGFYSSKNYSEIVKGTALQAIEGMKILNRKVGILCGPTSGLVYLSVIEKLKEMPTPKEVKKVVFIACDRIEPYMEYIEKYEPSLFSRNASRRIELTPEEIANCPTLKPSEISKQENLFLVDTRSNYSFVQGHIKGSINLPQEALEDLVHLGGGIFPKDATVVLVCPVGRISKRTAALLVKKGYNAYSLLGGIMSWTKENELCTGHTTCKIKS